MSRTKLIEKYAGFDKPETPQNIEACINDYIDREGIELLPEQQIHGRHTGHIDISRGGFIMDYDFMCPALWLCKVDRNGVVSADLRKINKYFESWRDSLYNPPKYEDGEEMDDLYDDDDFDPSDFEDDDDLHVFKNASYLAEMDSYMSLESPTPEDIIAHETSLDEIWKMKSNSGPEDGDEYEDDERKEYERKDNEDEESSWHVLSDEETAIYLQAVEDMYQKTDNLLETCRRIFYTNGRDALHEFLLAKEKYTPDPKYDCEYDDPEYFSSTDIKNMRDRFDVWDKEEQLREVERIYQDMKAQVDEYWNDPNREQRTDWICPTLAEDMRQEYLDRINHPSFPEFVSDLRRGIYGELPEDYDGLAGPGEPGYYGEEEEEDDEEE